MCGVQLRGEGTRRCNFFLEFFLVSFFFCFVVLSTSVDFNGEILFVLQYGPPKFSNPSLDGKKAVLYDARMPACMYLSCVHPCGGLKFWAG